MTNTPKHKPTDAELDILRVLWSQGPCTVRQVHENLPPEPPRGYTTVLKLMQIMSEKGLVRRDKRQRAHVYEATVAAEQTQRNLLTHLLDKVFAGSSSQLVMRALSAGKASKEELAEIKRLIGKMEKESK